MQKVLQRAQRAERGAARKLQKTRDHQEKGQSWERAQQRKNETATVKRQRAEARVNRRIDWEAGALAPRRDVGTQATKYGTLSINEIQLVDKDPKKRPMIHLAEGDRVVVVRGRDMGKIGEVTDVFREKGAVTVKGVNVIDVFVPEWLRQEEGLETTEIQAHARALPAADVKLVYPLPDPETDIPRDVIIDRLVLVNRRYDKDKREWDDGHRLIPGTDTVIPWPEKSEPQHEANPDDTLRITSEHQTFRPFLLHPPMPSSVLDELRNKYSKFRTRHDWEYIQQKNQEDAKMGKRKELIKGMRTPLQELAELRRRQREVREKELSEQQLVKIGEVIAQERAKAVGAVRQMEQ